MQHTARREISSSVRAHIFTARPRAPDREIPLQMMSSGSFSATPIHDASNLPTRRHRSLARARSNHSITRTLRDRHHDARALARRGSTSTSRGRDDVVRTNTSLLSQDSRISPHARVRPSRGRGGGVPHTRSRCARSPVRVRDATRAWMMFVFVAPAPWARARAMGRVARRDRSRARRRRARMSGTRRAV